MKTSKSLQLLDTNNVNISPVVGVDSIFFEETSDDGKAVKRKKLSDKLILFEKNGEINIETKTYDDVIADGGGVIIDVSSKAIKSSSDVSLYSLSVAKVSLEDIVKAATGEGTYATTDALAAVSAAVNEVDAKCTKVNSSLAETDASVKKLWDSSNSGGSSFDPTDINSNITKLNASVNTLDTSIQKANSSISVLNTQMTTANTTIENLKNSLNNINEIKNDIADIDNVLEAHRVSIENHDSSIKKLWDSSNSGGSSFDPTNINSSITKLNTSIKNINSSINKINTSLANFVSSSSLKTVNNKDVVGSGNVDTVTPELLAGVKLSIQKPQTSAGDSSTDRVLWPGTIIAYVNYTLVGTVHTGYESIEGAYGYSLNHPWFFYDGPILTDYTKKIDTSIYLVKNNVPINDNEFSYIMPERFLPYASNGDTIYLQGELRSSTKKYNSSAGEFYVPVFIPSDYITLDGIMSLRKSGSSYKKYKYLDIGILTDKDNKKMQFIGGNMMNKIYEWDSESNQLVPYVVQPEKENIQIIEHDYTLNANEFDFANWKTSSDANYPNFAFEKQIINYNFDTSNVTGAKQVNLTFSYDNAFEMIHHYMGGSSEEVEDGNIGKNFSEIEFTVFGENKSTKGTESWVDCVINPANIEYVFNNTEVLDDGEVIDNGYTVHVFASNEIRTSTHTISGGQSYMMHVKFVEDKANNTYYIYVKDFLVAD